MGESDAGGDDPARGADPKRELKRLARSGRPAPETEAKLLKLVQLARKNGQEEALLDALSAADLALFSSMAVVQAILFLAADAGREGEIIDKLDDLRSAPTPPPQWTPGDKKKVFGKQARETQTEASLVRQLLSLKYAQGPASFADPKSAAEFYAGRVRLPPALIDTLHAASRRPSADRSDYARRLQGGFAFEHVVNELPRRGANREIRVPVITAPEERDWADRAFELPAAIAADPRRPAVFLTFHGSLFNRVKAWYSTVFPEGERIGTGTPRTGSMVSSKDNANGALLESYRALIQGKPLLIAADSPAGTAKNLMSVLGRDVPIADGFVFLAYEAKAQVHWIVVVEEDGRLTPRIIAGPGRGEGEKMADYRERLIGFVAAQITDYLTGDPQQICLGSKWIGLLSGHEAAYKERYYRPA